VLLCSVFPFPLYIASHYKIAKKGKKTARIDKKTTLFIANDIFDFIIN